MQFYSDFPLTLQCVMLSASLTPGHEQSSTAGVMPKRTDDPHHVSNICGS